MKNESLRTVNDDNKKLESDKSKKIISEELKKQEIKEYHVKKQTLKAKETKQKRTKQYKINSNKIKPKYNMWQMSWYMIQTAWKEKEKRVILFGISVALLSVASYLLELYLAPVILQQIEDRESIGAFIRIIVLFAGGLILVKGLKGYINENSLYPRISNRMAMIAKINDKLLTTSYPHLEDDEFIKLYKKTLNSTNSNQSAGEAIYVTLSQLLENVLGFVIYLGLSTSIHPYMILLIIITTVIGYFVNKKLGNYIYEHKEEDGEIDKQLWYAGGIARDNKAAKDIRIFGMSSWINELNTKAIELQHGFYHKVEIRYLWGKIVDIVLTFVRNGVAYWYLISKVLGGELSIPMFLLYFSVIGGFTTWLTGILNNMNKLHQHSLDLNIVREVLEKEELFLYEEGESIQEELWNSYDIRLENVSFSYPNSDKKIIENMNFHLTPGEKVAVVGLNGAGKTTLIKLLCGFYDPTEGRVLLNGIDVRQYNRREYYGLFSAIFQNFKVLPISIAGNVAQTEKDIDMECVKECIELVGLSKKIESLPDKLDTKLVKEIHMDAIALSGGETQRLMIARALYKNGPIVILDEPTAALDPIAEEEIYQQYNEITQAHASIFISHRLASTRFCDRIILLENGRIIEEGTHDALMKLNGRYRELYDIQSKYYQEGGEE